MTETAQDTAPRTTPRRGEARAALMQAALELVATEANFSAISLRRIAREAGVVPTAFYRHFDDMEALGLTLVTETFAALRRLLHDAEISALPLKGLIRYSVDLFARHVRGNRLLFQFAVKERFSGTASIRTAIRAEIRILTRELARDFGRFSEFQHIETDDLRMIAELVVNTMISLSERILEVPADSADNAVLMQRAEKQLRLIFLGVSRWESRPGATSTPIRIRQSG